MILEVEKIRNTNMGSNETVVSFVTILFRICGITYKGVGFVAFLATEYDDVLSG
jgi:hypothetical protein